MSRNQEASLVYINIWNAIERTQGASNVLTNDENILLYNTWRIGADLAFICSLVFFYHRFDFQLPVIRVLEFNFIATISWIRLLAYRQQFQTTFAWLASYPRYLCVLERVNMKVRVSELVFIYCWNWILPFEWKDEKAKRKPKQNKNAMMMRIRFIEFTRKYSSIACITHREIEQQQWKQKRKK